MLYPVAHAVGRFVVRQLERPTLRMLQVAHAGDQPICRPPRLLRRTIVFLGISCATVGTAAWITNERTHHWWKRVVAETEAGSEARENATWGLKVERRVEVYEKWKKKVQAVLPASLFGAVDYPASLVSNYTSTKSDIFFFFCWVTALNVTVHALSWHPRCRVAVMRYFTHSGLSGKTYTVFTANFAHVGLLHITINTLVFWESLTGAFSLAYQEAPLHWVVAWPKLLAFWIVAGGFGYFVPTMLAVVLQKAAIRALPPSTSLWSPLPGTLFCSLHPSLGASPAIYALITVNALLSEDDPDEFQLGTLTYSAKQLLGTLLTIEIILYPFLNNGGPYHISGALFGYLYFCWGQQAWDWTRRIVGNQQTSSVRHYQSLPDGNKEPYYTLGFVPKSP